MLYLFLQACARLQNHTKGVFGEGVSSTWRGSSDCSEGGVMWIATVETVGIAKALLSV